MRGRVFDFDDDSVAVIQVQYRQLPFEARSALVVRGPDGQEAYFCPLRLKSSALELEAEGWPVVWRFRSKLARRVFARACAKVGVELPLDRPRWRPALDRRQ